jgi:hypothetical protein
MMEGPTVSDCFRVKILDSAIYAELSLGENTTAKRRMAEMSESSAMV